MKELPKTYNPHETEGRIYELWLQSKAFQPKVDSSKKPYTIAIPPPNVTGSLHMGHALNNTIQDILIRRARMRGIPALWVPGTDHAGIATQNVVEKNLAKEGKSRQKLGREEFEKEVWQWVDKYGHIIIDQLKKLGCSCDWSRQRFTMDEGYSEAVKAAFEHYYNKGWIYQGERVINWCVHCQTALSDIEVEHKEEKATLYYFRYDKDFPITIATTRPETKLGDTAVAVNPKDDRYKEYIGKTYKVNFCGLKRTIKVIADDAVDPKFGTGALGVTPAHSLIDAEMAEKNNLETVQVIDKYGRMTKEAGEFEGLKTKEAAQLVLDKLMPKGEQEGLLVKTEDITHNLSICYRCGRQIEPQPSKQWFLKMKELAQPAIAAVSNGEIKFIPEHWTKVYLDWMENLKDWCISRQIWWGHRLPVWEVELKAQNSKLKTNEVYYIGDNPPEGYKQVDDVLDTWFSSALWPFATLGWPASAKAMASKPEKNVIASTAKQSINEIAASPSAPRNDKLNDLAYFYPTTVLSTARDIIYLWVARMIFSGYEFMGEKPFSKVYIHPTIFNIEGKRMSKSLGTGIDPLELIDKYGADATRFGLTYINTGIQDIKFDEKAIVAGSKFCNKLWNIARFILLNLQNQKSKIKNQNDISKFKNIEPKTDADRQITQSLNHLITSLNSSLDNFRFGQAAHSLYDFVWHDLADIYLETAKKQLENKNLKNSTLIILNSTLINSLKLLHPFMPFVTEEIWQTLKKDNLVEEEMLINATWPKENP